MNNKTPSNLYNQALEQLTQAEQQVIKKFQSRLASLRAGSKSKPTSLSNRAKELNISPQALWEREKRQKEKEDGIVKKRGRPKKIKP